jgi:hypothetical protein
MSGKRAALAPMTAANGRPAARELVEFKFIVQAVFLIVEEGKTIGEQPADQIALYGLAALEAFCERFHADLAELNEQQRSLQSG